MVDSLETIANALLATLTSATGSVTWGQPPSRAAKIWAAKSPADQPCLFLITHGGVVSQKVGFGVSKVIYHFNILIYMRADESSGTVPETQLVNMWTAIANALLPKSPGARQDLGVPALIENAWIEGEFVMDTGILDAQQMILIPVMVSTGLY